MSGSKPLQRTPLTRGTLIREFSGHTSRVCSLLVIQNNRVWSGSTDGAIFLHDAVTGEVLSKHHAPGSREDQLTALAYTPSFLWAASSNGCVSIMHEPTGRWVAKVHEHSGQATCLSASSLYCWSGSEDCTVRSYTIPPADEIPESVKTAPTHVCKAHSKWVRAVAAVHGLVWSGADDGSICVWNEHDGQLLRKVEGHLGGITLLFPFKDEMWSGCMDRTVKCWDAKSGRFLREIKGHTDTVTCLTATPLTLWTGSLDKTLRVWDLETLKLLRVISVGTRLWCLTTSASSVWGSCGDGSVRVWMGDHLDDSDLHLPSPSVALSSAPVTPRGTPVPAKPRAKTPQHSSSVVTVARKHHSGLSLASEDDDAAMRATLEKSRWKLQQQLARRQKQIEEEKELRTGLEKANQSLELEMLEMQRMLHELMSMADSSSNSLCSSASNASMQSGGGIIASDSNENLSISDWRQQIEVLKSTIKTLREKASTSPPSARGKRRDGREKRHESKRKSQKRGKTSDSDSSVSDHDADKVKPSHRSKATRVAEDDSVSSDDDSIAEKNKKSSRLLGIYEEKLRREAAARKKLESELLSAKNQIKDISTQVKRPRSTEDFGHRNVDFMQSSGDEHGQPDSNHDFSLHVPTLSRRLASSDKSNTNLREVMKSPSFNTDDDTSKPFYTPSSSPPRSAPRADHPSKPNGSLPTESKAMRPPTATPIFTSRSVDSNMNSSISHTSRSASSLVNSNVHNENEYTDSTARSGSPLVSPASTQSSDLSVPGCSSSSLHNAVSGAFHPRPLSSSSVPLFGSTASFASGSSGGQSLFSNHTSPLYSMSSYGTRSLNSKQAPSEVYSLSTLSASSRATTKDGHQGAADRDLTAKTAVRSNRETHVLSKSTLSSPSSAIPNALSPYSDHISSQSTFVFSSPQGDNKSTSRHAPSPAMSSLDKLAEMHRKLQLRLQESDKVLSFRPTIDSRSTR